MADITVTASINSDQAARGARRFRQSLDSTRPAVQNFDRTSNTLTRTLGVLAGALAVKKMFDFGQAAISTADSFALLKSRLDAVGTGGFATVKVIDAIADASERARTSSSLLTDVFAQNIEVFADLGLGASEAVRFAETLSKLGTISGNSLDQTQRVLFQLSQALDLGALRGQDFNSVAQNMAPLLRIMRSELGVTSAEFKKLSESGRISADVMINSVLNASGHIDQQFNKMQQTVGQSADVMFERLNFNFGKISNEVGVTKTWARLFDELADAAGGPGFQSAMRTSAELIKGVGDAMLFAVKHTGSFLQQSRLAHNALTDRLRDPSLSRDPADILADAQGRVESENQGGGFLEGLSRAASGAAGAVPLFNTEGPRRRLQLKQAEDKATQKLIGRAQQLLKQEQLLGRGLEARLDGQKDIELAVRNELDLSRAVNDELRAASPALADKLENQILATNSLEQALQKQSEVLDRNREFAEGFSSTLTSGFLSAASGAQSFSQSLREVSARLFEVLAQATLLKPLENSLSSSIKSGLGNFDIGSIFDGGSGGLIPFANGGVFNSPLAFQGGGVSGVLAESGPEGVFPLKRGASGKLGIEASGSGGGTQINNFYIDGDATDETVEKMRRVADEQFAKSAPGVVSESVVAVRRAIVGDPQFTRR